MTDGQRTRRHRNIAENCNRLNRVHERYTDCGAGHPRSSPPTVAVVVIHLNCEFVEQAKYRSHNECVGRRGGANL